MKKGLAYQAIGDILSYTSFGANCVEMMVLILDNRGLLVTETHTRWLFYFLLSVFVI